MYSSTGILRQYHVGKCVYERGDRVLDLEGEEKTSSVRGYTCMLTM